MLNRILEQVQRAHFQKVSRTVLNTPPLLIRACGVAVVTMVSQRDLLMYLVAIKTFLSRVKAGRPVVLNDGSLTALDIELLKRHLPTVTVLDMNGLRADNCPQGGCWERLILILELCRKEYVIQLDSDTITVGELDFVQRCIQENRSFTLGTRMGQAFLSPADSSKLVENSTSTHIQVAAERLLQFLPGTEQRRYVRGSAGFTGFARTASSLGDLQEFSGWMQGQLGPRWAEWGSEQVASNFLIANSSCSEVLPYPQYACFDPSVEIKKSDFLHFVGTYRYWRRRYTMAVAQQLAVLRGTSVSR